MKDLPNKEPTINRVRKIVRTFRKSATKNFILQKYVKEDNGKEFKLIIDCNTRWNSMVYMLEHFMLIETYTKRSLIGFKIYSISDNDINVIENILNVLRPIQMTVQALCRSDINLCKAEAAIFFMRKEVSESNNSFRSELLRALKSRIIERRNVYSVTLSSLTIPYITSGLDDLCQFSIFSNQKKKCLIVFCSDLLQGRVKINFIKCDVPK